MAVVVPVWGQGPGLIVAAGVLIRGLDIHSVHSRLCICRMSPATKDRGWQQWGMMSFCSVLKAAMDRQGVSDQASQELLIWTFWTETSCLLDAQGIRAQMVVAAVRNRKSLSRFSAIWLGFCILTAWLGDRDNGFLSGPLMNLSLISMKSRQ